MCIRPTISLPPHTPSRRSRRACADCATLFARDDLYTYTHTYLHTYTHTNTHARTQSDRTAVLTGFTDRERTAFAVVTIMRIVVSWCVLIIRSAMSVIRLVNDGRRRCATDRFYRVPQRARKLHHLPEPIPTATGTSRVLRRFGRFDGVKIPTCSKKKNFDFNRFQSTSISRPDQTSNRTATFL